MGLTCPVWIRYAMRVVSTRVLPDPAPARISAFSWPSDGGFLFIVEGIEEVRRVNSMWNP